MTDLFSSTTSLSDGKPDKDMDTELAAFIIAQKQKLQFQAQVNYFLSNKFKTNGYYLVGESF